MISYCGISTKSSDIFKTSRSSKGPTRCRMSRPRANSFNIESSFQMPILTKLKSLNNFEAIKQIDFYRQTGRLKYDVLGMLRTV